LNILTSNEMKKEINNNIVNSIIVEQPPNINDISLKNSIIIESKIKETSTIPFGNKTELIQLNQMNITQSQLYSTNPFKKSRSLNDIAALIKNYLNSRGKKLVEVFKIIDKDGNGNIDQNELVKGINNLNIKITEEEYNMLWRELTKNDKSIQKISYSAFKKYYETYAM